jgi:hypothetical protein
MFFQLLKKQFFWDLYLLLEPSLIHPLIQHQHQAKFFISLIRLTLVLDLIAKHIKGEKDLKFF